MAKTIKPYIVYLTKSIGLLSFYEKCKVSKILDLHEAWIIIRILKQMLVISDSFSHVGRYFKNDFIYIVLVLKKILSYEVHVLLH